jgi:tetraacyldisaccharide 4'-kinase
MFRLLAAICYRAVYLLHHALRLRPGAPLQYSQLIVVGSFRTGGAGKTPFCIWLCKHYAAQGKKVALLTHEYAFDETTMLRQKFSDNGNVEIFATNNRYRLAHELDRSQKFDYIVCDDGFEDSRLTGAVTLLLNWESAPTKISELWPCGKMRSLAKDHMANSTTTISLKCFGENPEIQFVVDKVSHLAAGEVFQENLPDTSNASIICGLGDPERFRKDIQEYGIHIKRTFFFKDHSKAFPAELEQSLEEHPQDIFIISEKDAARLPAEFIQKKLTAQIYVAHQTTKVSAETLQKLP